MKKINLIIVFIGTFIICITGALFVSRVKTVNANGYAAIRDVQVMKHQTISAHNVIFRINDIQKKDKEMIVNINIRQLKTGEFGFKKNNSRFYENMGIIGEHSKLVDVEKITDDAGKRVKLDNFPINEEMNYNLHFSDENHEMGHNSKLVFIVPNGKHSVQYIYELNK